MRKHKRDDEEEYQEVDDEDRDPDYHPEKDPEVDFIAEDTDIEGDEDTFEIEKHVHAINLQEVGNYIIEIRCYVHGFMKTVRKGKSDIGKEYKKLIHFMKAMVLKIGAYGLVEHTDVDAVFDTIIDPTCTMWKRVLHGAKTRSLKELV